MVRFTWRHARYFLTAALLASTAIPACSFFDPPVVGIIGDSITYMSSTEIRSQVTAAGFDPRIMAVPGVHIGQSRATVVDTAQSEHPDYWIIELGTNDAGASDTTWSLPFLAEWNAISYARCVIYLSVSPLTGAVAAQINHVITDLAHHHGNVHVLDWGTIEYSQPGWVQTDTIHPTPAGATELARLEARSLQSDCSP